MSTDQYLALFIEESGEHLQTLAQTLIKLKRGAGPFDAALEQGFRSAHTLKGAAGLMKFPSMEETSRAMEAVLRGMKAGKANIEPATVELLLKGLDGLKSCFTTAISEGSDAHIDNSEIIKALYGTMDPKDLEGLVR